MTIVELEKRILQTYNTLSPIRDFHRMMREYRDILIEVKNERPLYGEKKVDFIKSLRVKGMSFLSPINNGVNDIFRNTLKYPGKYFDFAFINIFGSIDLMQGRIVTNPTRLMENSPFGIDDYIFNQVVIGEGHKDYSYNIGFSDPNKIFIPLAPYPSGIYLENINFNEEYFKISETDPNIAIATGFPEQSYLKSAVFNMKTEKLIKVSRRLD